MATLTIARAKDAAGNPTNGTLAFDDGSVFATFSSDVTVTVAAGNVVVYNLGSSPVALPAGTTTAAGATSIAAGTFAGIPGPGHTGAFDLSQDAYATLVNIGSVSEKPDGHTGNLYMVGFHTGVHVVHGQHISNQAVGRKHQQNHNGTKHHHKDVLFSITSGTVATLTWTAGTLVDNNGATIANISANNVGITVSAGQILYWNGTTYTTTTPGGVDFTVDTSIGYYVVGHFSAATDASGYMTLYGWHGGINQVGSNQIRNGAVQSNHIGAGQVNRGHHNVNVASKHHHHGTTLECVGSTLYVNYTPGGGSQTGLSTLQVDAGNYYNLNPTLFSVVAGDWVYIDINGFVNGSTVIPTHAGTSNFTPTETQIILCRISSATDSDGNYMTEGWHPGAHKIHSNHLKNSAVKTSHISSNAVVSSHIGAGQIHGGEGGNTNHIAGGAVQTSHLGSQVVKTGNIWTVNAISGGAILSGQDLFTASNSTNWNERNWAGINPDAIGTIGAGNLSNFTSWMTEEMLEISVGCNGGVGSIVYGAWRRVKLYKSSLSGTAYVTLAPLDYAYNNGQFYAESGQPLHSTTFNVIVFRFDILPSGNVNCVYDWSWNPNSYAVAANPSVGVQFRAVFNVGS